MYIFHVLYIHDYGVYRDRYRYTHIDRVSEITHKQVRTKEGGMSGLLLWGQTQLWLAGLIWGMSSVSQLEVIVSKWHVEFTPHGLHQLACRVDSISKM